MQTLLLILTLQSGIMLTDYTPPFPIETQEGLRLHTQISAELILYEKFFIRSDIRSDMEAYSLFAYIPYRISYTVVIGFRYDILEIGFLHKCAHPIETQFYQKFSIPFAGREEFYIKITGKIPLL